MSSVEKLKQLAELEHEEMGVVHVPGLGWNCFFKSKKNRLFLSDHSFETPETAILKCRELIAKDKWKGKKE